MSKVDIQLQEREVTVRHEVVVVSVSLDKKEVDKILLDHVLSREISKHGSLDGKDTLQQSVSADIDWRHEEYDGFTVELVYAK